MRGQLLRWVLSTLIACSTKNIKLNHKLVRWNHKTKGVDVESGGKHPDAQSAHEHHHLHKKDKSKVRDSPEQRPPVPSKLADPAFEKNVAEPAATEVVVVAAEEALVPVVIAVAVVDWRTRDVAAAAVAF